MENTTVSGFRLDNGGTATLHMDYFRPEPLPRTATTGCGSPEPKESPSIWQPRASR